MMKQTNKRFTMLELVYAIVVLGIVSTVFVGQFRMLNQMRSSFTQENRCLVVLDNTLERLALGGTAVDEARATAILQEEFALAQMPRKGELVASVIWQGEQLRLAILKPNGKPVAAVRIAP